MSQKTGTVKFFNSKKAYGFILDDEQQTEIFVHATGLEEEISANDKVQYAVEQTEKGPVAVNVRLIDSTF